MNLEDGHVVRCSAVFTRYPSMNGLRVNVIEFALPSPWVLSRFCLVLFMLEFVRSSIKVSVASIHLAEVKLQQCHTR